jgi:TonB family protein
VILQPRRVFNGTEVSEVRRPQLEVSAPKFDSKVLNALPDPKTTTKVIVNTSFGGSSATPTLQNIVPRKVQTGGFGDLNGVPVNAHGSGRSNIAAAGSFDLPSGAGYGNGTGGAKGARGTFASAGFGNGTAVLGNGAREGNAGQRRVQSAGFNAVVVAPANTDAHRAAAAQPASVPVSIQSKPTPVYTSEAREKRVEGEVLVNVLFTADGKVKVLNIVRGLGFGLDEAAQRAVQGLKFTPAQRDGRPVDSNATLHVVFRLS